MQATDTHRNLSGGPADAYIDALKKGDFAGIPALFAKDYTMYVPGTTRISGKYMAGDDFMNLCFQEVTPRFDMSAGENYHKASRIACRDHNGVVALVHGGVPVVGGGRYDQRYCMIWTVTDGRFTHFFEMLDTYMVETALLQLKFRVERPIPQPAFDISLVGRADNPGGTRDKTVSVAERLLLALRENNRGLLNDVLSSRLIANIVGRTPYSGRTTGLEAFLGKNFDWHGNLLKGGNGISGFYRVMVADANAFCMLLKADGETKAGAPYHQDYCVVGQVLGDQISEMHIWLDTALAESALFDNPIVGGDRKPAITSPFSIY